MSCRRSLLALVVTWGVLGFGGPPSAQAGAALQGAGATFPLPFYQTLIEAYAKRAGVTVDYRGVGSGEGIRQILERKVDFGATDAFLTAAEAQKSPAPLVLVPTCLGAVVLTHYLPGNPKLRLTPEVIADLFLGTIKRWSDPRIAQLNPDARIPDLPVRVVRRQDGSGTTYIFTEYLSKTSSVWREKVGTGKAVAWPVGIGGEGNPGVAGLLTQVPGSIGYVELIYALGNDLPVAVVRNRAGRFIEPTPESVSRAAQAPLPEDTNASLTDTPVPDAYPIGSFTWLAFYKEQDYDGRARDRAEALLNFLWWVTHDGQANARSLSYAPLPDGAVRKAETLLRSATYRGQAILR